MKTILEWIFVIVVAVVVFCLWVILIPMQTKVMEKVELTYIFVDEYWNEYDIFEPVHGAATDWSFLFDESKKASQEVVPMNTRRDNNENTPTRTDYLADVTSDTSEEIDMGDNFREETFGTVNTGATTGNLMTGNLTTEVPNSKNNITGMINTGVQTGNLVIGVPASKSGAIEKDSLEERLDTISTGITVDELIKEVDALKKGTGNGFVDAEGNESCITPWKTLLKHGESVIAYEQRKDAPNVCNAQRRTCNNGVLNWTYMQWFCDEGVEYKYTRVKVISYNNNAPGELIQNPWYAKNDSSEFDTRGKINPDTKIPKTDWDNSVKDWTKKDSNINLWKKTNYDCASPWWDVVQHGQFIKAYRSPVWYTDQLCQVELRLCLDWVLNWAYTNKTCEYVWVSSQDYVEWNVDVTKPSQGLLNEVSQENPNKKWFRGRLKGRFG